MWEHGVFDNIYAASILALKTEDLGVCADRNPYSLKQTKGAILQPTIQLAGKFQKEKGSFLSLLISSTRRHSNFILDGVTGTPIEHY